MHPTSHSTDPSATTDEVKGSTSSAAGSANQQATTAVRGIGSTASQAKNNPLATNTTSATAVPIPAAKSGKPSNKRRLTADTADPSSSSSSSDKSRAEYQPVLLRNPVQPWAPPLGSLGTVSENRHIRPLTLDLARRSSSFNDALNTSTSFSTQPSLQAEAPLSPSLAGKSQSSANMLATSRVSPYYHPPSHLNLTTDANATSSSVPSASFMQHDARFVDIQEGMTSVSPTRATFVERHARGPQPQRRQRTLSDMHPSNFAALHTALAKAAIAAGEDDKGQQNNRKRTQSCDICRVRKVKCVRPDDDDGSAGLNTRCKQCEANDANCTYAYVPKKPGPQSSTLSISMAKSHARRATEERQHTLGPGGSGTAGLSNYNETGLLHLSGIAQQRTLSAQELQAHSILQQLSPVHPSEAQWTSAYVQPPLFSPTPGHTSSDAGSNPFDNHLVVGAGSLPSYERRLDGFPTDNHPSSSYSTSSVSASPSVSTFAHAAQHSGGMSASPQPQAPLDNVVTTGRVSAGPSSPLASFAMTASASAPRPQQLQQHPSAAFPSNAELAGATGPAHLMPAMYGSHATGQQQQHFYVPSSSNGLSSIVTAGPADAFNGHQMPLHSAPPTMTHFNLGGGPHIGPQNVLPMAVHPSDQYHPQGLLPPRNASFSHALPMIPNQFTSPSLYWQQHQQEQQQDYPDNLPDNSNGMW